MIRALGIDVYQGDGKVDFSQMAKAGASFTFIKASQQVADSHFKINWQAAKDAGLLRGAYHFLDWRMDILAQIKIFVSLLQSDPGELPPMLDYEMVPASGTSAAQATSKLLTAAAYIQTVLGCIPGIYTGFYFWADWGTLNSVWAKYPLWLPWYASEAIVKTPKPWSQWSFWQYTDRADGLAFGAEAHGVDASYYNGTVDDLKKAFAPTSPITQVLDCPYCGHALDPNHWSYKP
jgi:lysozyme